MTTPATILEGMTAVVEPKVLADRDGQASGAGDAWPPPSPEFLARVSHDFARRHLILSEGCAGGVERLVAAEHAKESAIFNVGVRLKRAVRLRHAAPETIAAAIDRAYAAAAGTAAGAAEADVPAVVVEGSGNVETDLDAAVREAERDLLNTQGKAPAVRLVDLVLFEALLRGASDVHVQPVRDRTLVRYRLDGALHTVRELPGSLASSVVSRIKVMARLDVAEHRTPQDGRATVTVGGSAGHQSGRRVDLRISILPSTYGERVVLRLLDPSRSPHLLNFSALGMPPEVERRYLAQVSRTSGIVLSTGPTGSGKTTTLYTTLAWLSTTNAGGQARGCELNMMTVEDPVEYDLSTGGKAGLSVSQTQVDPKKGVTFVTGLKHILRQDPDVIMVGEVRDEETARIAVQASLTGHLVLSTLHTNDAASAVARLLDLGVEPFLVSSSLSAVLAQRLVRTRHAACEGAGCPECVGTGFKGRTGVFELLVLDAAIRDMVCRRASALDIKAAAQRAGMVTLREAGERLAASGATTREEVGRVIDALDEVET
ncbi:MAG: type II secretion system protein GspE [Phycisphaerae bacterium]|nr:MAG: type II secretion system protein GspE [Phycisphaerae bacterium]